MSEQREPDRKAEQIAQEYQRPQGSAGRLLASSILLGAILLLLILARWGLDWVRIACGLGILVAVAATGVWLWRSSRQEKNVAVGLTRALGHLDAQFAGRVERAYRLFKKSSLKEAELHHSQQLAELHAVRLLDAVDLAQVRDKALFRRRLRLRLGLVFLASALGVALFFSLQVAEGLDVLLAKDGIGPYPIAYVEELEITAEWPSYLDGTGRRRDRKSVV